MNKAEVLEMLEGMRQHAAQDCERAGDDSCKRLVCGSWADALAAAIKVVKQLAADDETDSR